MEKMREYRLLSIISSFALVFIICSFVSSAQGNTDTEKLYAEITGDYEFTFEGQSAVITFFVEEGVLMGRDSEYDPGTPLEPVEGKELEFTATADDGQFFEIKFSRDENNKITKCLLVTMGMEIPGVKVKKQNSALFWDNCLECLLNKAIDTRICP